ncbi:TPA: TIGR00159 family protein [Candidatus Scatousia excrementigallinarum]|uniref:Diadenylate cyclase n=1 Tax=Candidatus Scatousia excrementigallinarum TaxID=2840935 RepID=A0A9D1EZQ2_9BACT|nr:TIGR00159 family protein [Candidatus Scatousia excrementigallinarum]
MFDDILFYLHSQIGAMDLSFNWTNLLEIFVIVLILYAFYKKFIKNTQSEKFVKGIFILIFVWVFGEILVRLDLKILGMFLKSIVTLVSLSLIVIFQPELRRFLGFLGQVDFISKAFTSNNSKNDSDEKIDVIKEIVEAVRFLSKSHTGALIVFQNDLSNTYYDVGTKLNADLSTELLLTIFHPNTPLHDGAVVINDSKIISAGVLLPLTEDPKLSWKYGTRHRAAIGMSETSEAACLVVSEETGDVSIALDGTLKKYEDLITLKTDLENILGYKDEEKFEGNKKTIFKINNFITIRKNVDKKDS